MYSSRLLGVGCHLSANRDISMFCLFVFLIISNLLEGHPQPLPPRCIISFFDEVLNTNKQYYE